MALLVLIGGAVPVASAQTSADVQLAVLQYRGGGDWYANPTAVPNLVDFRTGGPCNQPLQPGPF